MLIHCGLQFRSMEASEAERVENTTLPLERTVFTLNNLAASTAAFKVGIFRFMGLTPRKKAACGFMAIRVARCWARSKLGGPSARSRSRL